MPSDPFKLTKVYLTLWKACDVHFRGHSLLEITDERPEDLIRELKVLKEDDLSRWAPNPDELRQQIEDTLTKLEEQTKDDRWYRELSLLKDDFQEKALNFGRQLQDP